ncbi:restriction endonuclease subunit S [Enterococcus eurekensis]
MTEQWERIKLKDIIQTNVNTYSLAEKWDFVNYLDTGNLTEDEVDEYQHIIVEKNKLPSRARRKVKLNDILYSTVRPNQLHYGIVKNIVPNMLVSTGFTVITVDELKADSEFVYYFLTQNKVTEILHSIGEQSTSAYPSIKPSDIENLEIILPRLDTQRKIARILRVLDNKIENNKKLNHHLEQIATSIFNDRFINLKQFNGKIPSNWKKGVLGDFVQIKRGGSPRPIQNFLSKEGYRWLKISDVSSLDSPFIYNIRERIREEGLKKTILLKPGSLVLSNSATPGIPKILSVESCIHDGWLYFPESELPNEFLYLFFQAIRPNLIQLGNGSVFTNLKTDILKKYEFYMPEKNVIEEFNKVIGPIFSTIQSITEENLKLIEIKDYLLPKLMSGKISATS